MDFQSAMETFAEAWVAANTGKIGMGGGGGSSGGSSSCSPGVSSSGGVVGNHHHPFAGALGSAVGTSSAAEQMSLVAAAAAIQQQLGKGVVVGGAGSCSSSNSSASVGAGADGGGVTGSGIVSTSSVSGSGGTTIFTSSSTNSIATSTATVAHTNSESALIAAAAAAAAALGESSVSSGGRSGGSTNTAVGIVGLDYHSLPPPVNKLLQQHHSQFQHPAAVNISSLIGGMPGSALTLGPAGGGGIDLSPPNKRLKSSLTSGGGSGNCNTGGSYMNNGSLGGMGLLKKMSANGLQNHPVFQHLAHSHMPMMSGALDMDFVDPSGLLAGHNLSLGKSLPIHCVIEVISESSGGINSGNSRGDRGRDGSSGGKSETSAADGCGGSRNSNGNNGRNSPGNGSSNSGGCGKVVEVDDFVIIPSGTPFQEVVSTVLTLLGYPKETIQQAVGMISLKNWKPLMLDQVCDSPHKTVGDILNDLTNHATLRVLVTRAKGGTTDDLKEKLLRLLLAQSSSLLLGSGCPLDEVTLSQLMKGQWPQNLAEDVKRRFDQWYATHFQQRLGSNLESLQNLPHHHQSSSGSHHHLLALTNHSAGPAGVTSSSGHHGGSSSSSSRENGGVPSPHHAVAGHLVNGANGGSSLSSVAAAAAAAAAAAHHQGSTHLHHHVHPSSASSSHGVDLQVNKSSFGVDGANEDHPGNHPVFHGLTTQKTRMRTSFDPEMELPKLQQWFAENPHPSRHQIQQYVRDLNSLECRKDRKPLDVNNVIYWFKNARAAQKRNELRYNGLAAFPHAAAAAAMHHHPHHSQHTHHSSPISAAAAAAAIHLHNQAHNQHHSHHHSHSASISPGGDDDDVPSRHLHHSHHHHHRVSRSLDSDHEQENSHEGDDSEESRGGMSKEDFSRHHPHGVNIPRGSRGSNDDMTSTSVATGRKRNDDDRSGDEEDLEESMDQIPVSRKIKRDPLDDASEQNALEDNEDNGADLGKSADMEVDGEDTEGEKSRKERVHDGKPSKVLVKEEQNMQSQDDDFISVDVELTEGRSPEDCCSNNNEPKDLSGRKSGRVGDYEDDREDGDHHLEKEDAGSPSAAQSNSSIEKQSKDGGGLASRLTPDDPDQLHPQQQHHRHVSNHSTSSSISPRSSPGVSPSHNYDFSGAPSMVGRFPHSLFEHPSFMAYRHFNSFNFGGGNFPGGGNGGDGGGPVGYESALSMVAAANSARGKGMMVSGGKPSPPGPNTGLDLFHEFQNGLPGLLPGARGPGGSSGGASSGAGADPLGRLRGDEICSPRGVSSADIISMINSNRSGGAGDLGMGPLNLGAHHHHLNHHSGPNSLASSLDERRKRNRTFIDPVTEVPRLEQWFGLNTHPSHNLILKYTDELNRMPYRQKFPKLEPKNVQFWFKNRRAKCKRLKMTL